MSFNVYNEIFNRKNDTSLKCRRGVNFPIRQLFDTLLEESKNLQRNQHGYWKVTKADKTFKILQVFVERFEEQFHLCDFPALDNEKLHKYQGKFVKSELYSGFENYNGDKLFKKFILNQYYSKTKDHNMIFEIKTEEDKEYHMFTMELYSMHLNKKSYFDLMFNYSRDTDEWIISMEYENRTKALDCFDPDGTGYEFFTPTQVQRYNSNYPADAREGHTITSPEIRAFEKIPKLRDRLMRQLEQNEIRVKGPPNKRQRTKSMIGWNVSGSGYAFLQEKD